MTVSRYILQAWLEFYYFLLNSIDYYFILVISDIYLHFLLNLICINNVAKQKNIILMEGQINVLHSDTTQ